jgi:hypothetical protein
MPISAIFITIIFSDGYKFTNISDRQNVTNVVKNYVKKLSVGHYFQVSWGDISAEFKDKKHRW